MPDTVISSRSAAPRHRQGAYDNPFAPDNVYGHAVALLSRHRVKSEGALHIDIGSGFGRIAEPLVAELGVSYLACDLDEDALSSLAQRGFETHRLVLDTEAGVYRALVEIIGARQLASISIIDTLEHLDDPAATLRALSRIAGEYQAFVLISVPNTAHRDLGLRLLFGLWDYTETGILDHTHRTLFSDAVLRRMLAGNGLHIVDANDVKMASSDQAYPADHPAFQSGTRLHRLLCELRDLGDGFGSTNQLVRLCTAGPAVSAPPFDEREFAARPLLSVVIRSEGRQPDLLAELMTCLAGQTVTDFEILLLGHRLDRQRQVAIERAVLELPDWLRRKISFLRIDHGNRTDLLNDGFAAAAGRYIAVLDETDVVFAHWAENFMRAAEIAPGRILHLSAVMQQIRRVEYNFATGIRAESAPHDAYPLEFDLFEQLGEDDAKLPGIAFPRGLFHHLHLAFDPALEILAGQDYLLRGAAFTGVTSAPACTAIRREWDGAEVHGAEIERIRLAENFAGLAAPLWPAETVEKLRHRLTKLQGRAADAVRLAASVEDLQHRLAKLQDDAAGAERQAAQMLRDAEDRQAAIAAMAAEAEAHHRELAAQAEAHHRELAAKAQAHHHESAAEAEAHLHALQDVLAIYHSSSWRVTAPLRLPARLAGRRPINPASASLLSTSQLQLLGQQLRTSRSWRLTVRLRRGSLSRSG